MSHKGTWKIESVVYELKEYDPIEHSEYTSNKKYLPPEAFVREKFSLDELNNRLVWNLGCILINIIVGSHKLNSQEIF